MSVKKTVVLSDDLNGSEKDVKTVTFGFEGKTYEIDLDTLNRNNLSRSLKKYVEVARPVKSVKTGKSTKSSRDLSAVRVWARENGHEVSERGRIAGSVMEAYEQAQIKA